MTKQKNIDTNTYQQIKIPPITTQFFSKFNLKFQLIIFHSVLWNKLYISVKTTLYQNVYDDLSNWRTGVYFAPHLPLQRLLTHWMLASSATCKTQVEAADAVLSLPLFWRESIQWTFAHYGIIVIILTLNI